MLERYHEQPRENERTERNAEIVQAFITEHLTVRELAARYGITFQRVQQILSRALGSIRPYRSAFHRREIEQLHAQATTIEEFATLLNTDVSAARQCIRNHRLPTLPSTQRLTRDETHRHIINRYLASDRPVDIAAEQGWSTPSPLYYHLIKAGIETRHLPQRRKRS